MREYNIKKINLIKHIALRITLAFVSIFCTYSLSLADTKISPEDAFLQGQQYLEQANTPLAEVSLTRIPANSSYAKLLAGNIAAKNGDVDRTFLLLLPLQSNTSLIKPAAASLHASLSYAYEKQGDHFNALDQLIRREEFLSDSSAIESNTKNIWQLLSGLTVQDLIATRGESTDTATQGWIDLSLATKHTDKAGELSTWFNSYPDHPATAFAKTLSTANQGANQTQANIALPLNGNIALILPFDNAAFADKSNAFKLGLQAALNKNNIPNTIKTYTSLGDQESFGDLYAYAKDEGASYFIGPLQASELIEANPNVHAISLLDSNLAGNKSFQHAGLSLHDQAQAISTFATSNAIQHITILTTDTVAASQMTTAFLAIWKDQLGYEANIITLPKDLKPADASLLDLKSNTSAKSADMLLLAMSADEARIVRPYLDISTPNLAFSSVNDSAADASNNALNAVRFVDIPFVLDSKNNQFSYYREQAAELPSNELKRWFALGVDTLQLLLASSRASDSETMINGLTGKLVINKTGHIARQLPMARFSYDGVTLEN